MDRSPQHDDTDGIIEIVRERRLTIAPADLVLIALPALLVIGVLTGLFSTLSLWAALTAGTVPALLTLGYALFYDPPSGYASG